MSTTLKSSLVFMCFLLLAAPLMADRTTIRSGWNLFSVQQDIEMGRRLADEVESTMPVVEESFSNGYISALGRQLAAHAPGSRYQYEFRILDSDSHNSYALPGGFIYVTRGMVEAAKSEPELAGLLAHQIAHVALRHGTQAASRAYSPKSNRRRAVNVGTVMSSLDIGFYRDSLILKHSASAEEQADVLAAQIMHDAGFDPRQMPSFFQRISSAEFFDNHAGNHDRTARVRREVQNMGGLRRNLRGDSPDLQTTQARLESHSRSATYDDDDPYTSDTPDLPSTRMVRHMGRDFEFRYPENWNVSEERGTISIGPSGGTINGSLAYGMMMATFEPTNTGYRGQTPLVPGTASRADRTELSRATDELIAELRRSNPGMRMLGSEERRRVDGEPALALRFSNESPMGGLETDWLVTVLRPDGILYYFIGVAPEGEFSRYEPAFERIISSVRFNN